MILSLTYQAIVIILLLTFSFGPAFFALINTGIKFGYKTGSFLAIGVVMSDFFLCLLVCVLVHFGMANLLHSEKTQTFFAIIGGIILIVFGAFFFKKIPVKTDDVIEIENQLPSPKLMFLKGFFLNLFNPTVWLLWLANVTAISKTLDYSMIKMVVFFSIVLGAVLLVELFKVKLAGKIKDYLTNKIMTIVNYITGTALIIFGLILIYNHYFNK
ncbi:MAG TPA: LysE family transporter [Bacteroidia bacterium]|nr:LysE family transporter [Bacteroidia bacterium]